MESWCSEAGRPVVEFFLHLVFGVTVALLDLAFELLALPVDLAQIIE